MRQLIRYAWKNELADAASENDIGAIALPADVMSNTDPLAVNDHKPVTPKGQLVFLDRDGNEMDRVKRPLVYQEEDRDSKSVSVL